MLPSDSCSIVARQLPSNTVTVFALAALLDGRYVLGHPSDPASRVARLGAYPRDNLPYRFSPPHIYERIARSLGASPVM